jgi:hypothetical protein
MNTNDAASREDRGSKSGKAVEPHFPLQTPLENPRRAPCVVSPSIRRKMTPNLRRFGGESTQTQNWRSGPK